jgi:hypothetical protein
MTLPATSDRLLVLGNTVADVLVRPIDRFPDPGLSLHVEGIDLAFGGCGAHTANTAAKLGIRTRLLSTLGDDAVGALVRVQLARNPALELGGVVALPGTRTSTSVVLIGPGGERSFVCYSGASGKMTRALVPAGFPDGVRVFHYAGFALLPGLVGEEAAELFRIARAAGSLTSMDVAWKQGFDHRAAILPSLPHLDFAMPNVDEACRISGERTGPAAARWLAGQGVGTALVTGGSNGVWWASRDGSGGHQPAFRIEAVDTTGAGDAFSGAFLAATLLAATEVRFRTLESRVRLAQAAGALTCTAVGGDAGVRGLEQVLDFVDSRRG